jgi:hypothetical protein
MFYFFHIKRLVAQTSLLIFLLLAITGCDQKQFVREVEVVPELLPVADEPTGCTHELADNFLSSPNLKEDGTCRFSICTQENFEFESKEKNLVVQDYLKSLDDRGIRFKGEIKNSFQCGRKIGCTLKLAANYDPKAEIENGLCQIKICAQKDYQYFSQEDSSKVENYLESLEDQKIDFLGTIDLSNDCGLLKGCMNEFATNYLAEAGIENGTCQFEGCTQNHYEFENPELAIAIENYLQQLTASNIHYSGTINNMFGCGRLKGCASKIAINYNQDAELEDGSCQFLGCADSSKENYSEAFDTKLKNYLDSLMQSQTSFTGSINKNYLCGKTLGCMATLADNYSMNAEKEDGTCVFKGCAIEHRENYNQSFDYALTSYLNTLNQNQLEFSGSIKKDYLCGKTLGCMSSVALNFSPNADKENGNCFFKGCLQQDHQNYDSILKETVDQYLSQLNHENIVFSGLIEDNFQCGQKLGCTAPLASNFSTEAQLDDSTCQFEFCPFDPDQKQIAEAFNNYKEINPSAPTFTNLCTSEQTDTYTQNYSGAADIIWVIDNSNSMRSVQNHIANNFNYFIDNFIFSSIEVNMAVTTSDNSIVLESLDHLTWTKLLEDEVLYKQRFKSHIKVGTGGSGKEKIFDGLVHFIETNPSEWVREDADLMAILVSDEKEQSELNAQETLDIIKEKTQKNIIVHSINYFDKDGIKEFSGISELSGGLNIDLNQDFSQSLIQIRDQILKSLTKFPLSQKPFEGSIRVFVDNIESLEWTFNTEEQTLYFNDGHVPEENQTVIIKYVIKTP